VLCWGRCLFLSVKCKYLLLTTWRSEFMWTPLLIRWKWRGRQTTNRADYNNKKWKRDIHGLSCFTEYKISNVGPRFIDKRVTGTFSCLVSTHTLSRIVKLIDLNPKLTTAGGMFSVVRVSARLLAVQPGNWRSIPGRSKNIFSSPFYPERLCFTTGFLFKR
jgi:hypothetical protein